MKEIEIPIPFETLTNFAMDYIGTHGGDLWSEATSELQDELRAFISEQIGNDEDRCFQVTDILENLTSRAAWDSFACGFKAGISILNQLNSYQIKPERKKAK